MINKKYLLIIFLLFFALINILFTQEIFAVENVSCGVSHSYQSCYNNDIYWHTSCGVVEGKVLECGEKSCGNWGLNYCSNEDVYRQRTCYSKGCADRACFSSSYIDIEIVQDCDSGVCQNGKCMGRCECFSGPCCNGCRYKPLTSVCDINMETEYGCPWGTDCGADVGKKTKSKFRYCSGNNAQCVGIWKDFFAWNDWLVTDSCFDNEVCSIGNSKCQYSSVCSKTSDALSVTPTAVPPVTPAPAVTPVLAVTPVPAVMPAITQRDGACNCNKTLYEYPTDRKILENSNEKTKETGLASVFSGVAFPFFQWQYRQYIFWMMIIAIFAFGIFYILPVVKKKRRETLVRNVINGSVPSSKLD